MSEKELTRIRQRLTTIKCNIEDLERALDIIQGFPEDSRSPDEKLPPDQKTAKTLDKTVKDIDWFNLYPKHYSEGIDLMETGKPNSHPKHCEHGRKLNGYCLPCNRVHSA